MAVAVKQQTNATSASGATSVAFTLPGAPTSGNLLVFAIAADKNSGTIQTWADANGWTVRVDIGGTQVSVYVCEKVSAGTETSITPAHSLAATAGASGWYAELEDTAVSGSSWSVLASSVPSYSDTATNSRSTGTTGSAASAGLALAVAGIDSQSNALATGSWSNSYTSVYAYTVSSGRAGVHVASKTIASGTTESTWSYTGTADQVYAAVIVWNKVDPGAGAALAGTAAGSGVTSGQPSPPWENSTLPMRAAFYYSWYDETWTVLGEPIHFTPVLGEYDLDGAGTAAIMEQHVEWMAHARIDVGVFSWWAQDDGNVGLTGTDHNEATRIPALFAANIAKGAPLKLCAYYEMEGFSDPSVAQLQDDLDYLLERYAWRSEYLHIGGKPVVFVYNSGDTAASNSVQRWADATNDFGDWYVVLKVFDGYTSVSPQPSNWHQYGPASRTAQHGTHSFQVSVGYWQANEPEPRLERVGADYAKAVRQMVAATVDWEVVVSFNEWGEGHAIEPEEEEGTKWLDVLRYDGEPMYEIEVQNAGDGTLSWTASKTQSWLTITPTAGTTTSETDLITATANPSGLSPGVYTDTVTVTAAGATNSPQTVSITLNVLEAAGLSGSSGGSGSTSGALSAGAATERFAIVSWAALEVPGTGQPDLTGTSAGSGSTSGSLTASPRLTASSAGAGTVSGSLRTTAQLSASTAGAGSTTGTLTVPGQAALSGSTAGAGSTSGTLRTAAQFAGSSTGAGSTAGTLTVPGTVLLTGSTAGAGSTSGSLSVRVHISGATAGAGSTVAVLSVPARITGSATGAGVTVATLISGLPPLVPPTEGRGHGRAHEAQGGGRPWEGAGRSGTILEIA
jgi:hypothetical protein